MDRFSRRVIRTQALNWAGTGNAQSAAFSAQTYGVRVISQVAGYVAVVNSTAESIAPSTNATSGTYIPISVADGCYLTCTPGQFLSFSSSTTSTLPYPAINVSEFD